MTSGTAHGGKTMFDRISHFLIIFAYLWLLLSVYTLHNSLVLSDWELAEHFGAATLKALVFAKFVLIGEHLKVGSRAERLPLIWPILVKAVLFAAMLIVFNLLEELLVGYFRSAASADGDLLEMTNFRVMLSLFVMAFVALVPFFGITELSRTIGRERMRDLFFRNGAGF
jgi:hypothetical protein